jgi:hypothetical protein
LPAALGANLPGFGSSKRYEVDAYCSCDTKLRSNPRLSQTGEPVIIEFKTEDPIHLCRLDFSNPSASFSGSGFELDGSRAFFGASQAMVNIK